MTASLEPLDPKPVRKANIWFRVAIGLMILYGVIAVGLRLIHLVRVFFFPQSL